MREIAVDDARAGQRIDNFLIGLLKGVPRERVYRLLRRGEVRVNGGRVRPHRRLRSGDVVRVPPVRAAAPAPPTAGAEMVALLEDRVLLETPGVLVLDKPAGLAVHGGSGRSYGVIEALRSGRPRERGLELVHRLDRDTSGCLVVAKRRSVLLALHRALREGRVEKRYLALLSGRLRRARAVDAPLERDHLRSGERVVRVDARGKSALTRFRPIATAGGATLCEAVPATGRTHQIRVHAAAIDHPVAGDPKYGDRAVNRRLRELGLRRLFLHASRVGFDDPLSEARVEVSAPLPPELVRVLEALGMVGFA